MVESGRLGGREQPQPVPAAKWVSALRSLVQRVRCSGEGGRIGRGRPCIGLRAGQVERPLLPTTGTRQAQGDQGHATRDTDIGECCA